MPEPQVAFAMARLRDWLAEARAEWSALGDAAAGRDGDRSASPPQNADGAAETAAPGLLRLLGEFTALRHELKLSTKSGRAIHEQAVASTEALGRAIAAFESIGPQEERAARTACEPWALAVAELDESLERAAAECNALAERLASPARADALEALDASFRSLSKWRQWAAAPFRKAAREVIAASQTVEPALPQLVQALAEGLRMIRERLARTMQRERLEPIPAVGRPVDPERMNVTAVVAASDSPPGTVVRELRRGYLFRGRLLRCADVQASVAATHPSSTES